jgi:hypothetical protein
MRQEGMIAMASKNTSGSKRGRSAITGKFVRQSTVTRNPKTTVNEKAGKSTGKK